MYIKELVMKNFNRSYRAEKLFNKYRKNSSNKFIKTYIRYTLAKKYGIYLGKNVILGNFIKLPHPVGIVIGDNVKIGDNVIIYQQVTIGLKDFNIHLGDRKNKYPEIKDGCVLYSGAKVIGDILVEENTVVAANAVLMKSTTKNSVFAGIPAIKIKEREL